MVSCNEEETYSLLDSEVVSAATTTGAGLVNNAARTIQQARNEGPLTFRTMGFIGGLAMIVSNALVIVERFFSFNFSRSLISIYGVIFGFIIVFMDAPFPVFCSQRIEAGIHCKFISNRIFMLVSEYSNYP